MPNLKSIFDKLVEENNKTKDLVQNSEVLYNDELEDADESVENDEPEVNKETIIENKPEEKPVEVKEVKPDYDKILEINNIYSSYHLEKNKTDTVFLLDGFINALPKELPNEVKVKTVLNIISASGTDIDKLLSDGKQRVEALNKFMNEYSEQSKSTISSFKDEIVKLTSLIDKYNETIKQKEKGLNEQKNIVKFEVEKINNIIDFFNNRG